jgi:hypothetical protein
MNNAKQFVLLGTSKAKSKGDDGSSFLWYEIKTIISLDLPVVVANLNGDRRIDKAFIPNQLIKADYYTVSVSFQPKIIQYALDSYAPNYAGSTKKGPHYYEPDTYDKLGL